MKRRDFIYTGMAAASLPILVNGMKMKAFASPKLESMALLGKENDRILLLINLNGGNDGLNTLIPINKYDILSEARGNVLIKENQILGIDETKGFHPAFSHVNELYKNGLASAVQGVGYPQPNLSHFRSTDIWNSASDSDKVVNSGWLGRYLYENHPGFPEEYPNADFPDPLSITVGNVVSTTCQGPVFNMGLAVANTENFYELKPAGVDTAPDGRSGLELDYLRTVIGQTKEYNDTIQTAAEKGKNLSPKWDNISTDNRLASQMKIVAKLISGGLRTKIYVVTLGGFDTHSGQVAGDDTTTGDHATLLSYVSESIDAFMDDIDRSGNAGRVLGMTYSEFGRRIISNLSNGTDHGSSAPMFFFGTKLRPVIHGENPVIPDNPTPQDNLEMQYDFRSVYWSVLKGWFEVEEDALQKIMLREFDYIPLFDFGTSVDENIAAQKARLAIAPNPVADIATIRFNAGQAGYYAVDIYDLQGRVVSSIASRSFAAGAHEMQVNCTGIPSGAYLVTLRNGKFSASVKMVKR